MSSVRRIPLTETEARIVEAAIGVFVRYGAKKTTMADIAEAAGISRQTVYASFGDKDGIIVACIRHVSEASLAAIRARLGGCGTLGERLDVYFEETVVKSFEMLQEAGDPEDLISGHNQAGQGGDRGGPRPSGGADSRIAGAACRCHRPLRPDARPAGTILWSPWRWA